MVLIMHKEDDVARFNGEHGCLVIRHRCGKLPGGQWKTGAMWLSSLLEKRGAGGNNKRATDTERYYG
jgi:hypothetical protein